MNRKEIEKRGANEIRTYNRYWHQGITFGTFNPIVDISNFRSLSFLRFRIHILSKRIILKRSIQFFYKNWFTSKLNDISISLFSPQISILILHIVFIILLQQVAPKDHNRCIIIIVIINIYVVGRISSTKLFTCPKVSNTKRVTRTFIYSEFDHIIWFRKNNDKPFDVHTGLSFFYQEHHVHNSYRVFYVYFGESESVENVQIIFVQDIQNVV